MKKGEKKEEKKKEDEKGGEGKKDGEAQTDLVLFEPHRTHDVSKRKQFREEGTLVRPGRQSCVENIAQSARRPTR